MCLNPSRTALLFALSILVSSASAEIGLPSPSRARGSQSPARPAAPIVYAPMRTPAHFIGAAMKWFMRLTGDGVGMHVGILPGYPASHGCIRMPGEGAKLFYDHVKVGTPVTVATAET